MTDETAGLKADTRRQVGAQLRQRARTHVKQAMALLALLLAVVAGGAYAFIFAESLSDLRQRDLWLDLQMSAISVSASAGMAKSLIASGPNNQELVNRMEQAAAGISAAAADINGQVQQIRELNQQDNGLHRIVAAASTRIGAAVLLVFFSQVIVSMYRHSIRLASYYDARADTLELIDFDQEEFIKIIPYLSPDHVDFGKMPPGPWEQAKEILALASKIKG